jgi:hypothetical protein
VPAQYRINFVFLSYIKVWKSASRHWPYPGQVNVLVQGLDESAISAVIKSTSLCPMVCRTPGMPPAITIHPITLIVTVFRQFIEEDDVEVARYTVLLKRLQEQMKQRDVKRVGDISLELGEASSDLLRFQIGNQFISRMIPSLKNAYIFPGVTLNLIQEIREKEGSNDEHPWHPLGRQLVWIHSTLEDLSRECDQRKYELECLQRQINLNINIVGTGEVLLL